MVTIKVNDIPVEQKMRVGSDGEAYFLSELMVDENGDISDLLSECPPPPACLQDRSAFLTIRI